MQARDRNRAVVIHTRKEVIVIFEELKNKINIAYESLTEEAFQNLLTVIRVIFYLHPIPHFLEEINSIGTIPVTVFLENLLVKTNMIRLAIAKSIRNWIITLMFQFKTVLPSLQLDQIKELKTKNFEIYGEWNEMTIISFAINGLELAVKGRDIGIAAVLIHFLRVFILFGEHNKQITITVEDQKWKQLVQNLVETTKILDNLKREEIAVCICYYLCLKDKMLCYSAIESGIIDYLVDTLQREFISGSFGKKIIEFIKYILLHLDNRLAEQINILRFEKALSSFSARFDKEEITLSIRDLVSILEQKISVIDYESKLEKLTSTYDLNSKHSPLPQAFIEGLYSINLYIHNERMGNLIVKYYPSLLYKILREQQGLQVIKLVAGFLSFHFKKGKLSEEVGVQIIDKISEIVNAPSLWQSLLQNRKALLISFVRIIKTVLENLEHHKKMADVVAACKLEQKLWEYSDFTNYMYEKQLIELRKTLGATTEHKKNQLQVLKELEADIINKSKFNLNKLTWELYQEVKFMENLLDQNGKLQGYKPSNEIPVAVSNYIQTTNRKATFTLLQNIENEQGEQLRKQFNLVCCKLLTKLLKQDKGKELAEVKNKMIALTNSKDEIDDIYDMINNFFFQEEEIQEEHERRQETIRASMRVEQELQQQMEFTDNIRNLLHEYFRNQSHFDINLVKINSNQDLTIVMDQLSQYQNQTDILKYLKVILELVQKDNVCGNIYKLLGQKLFQIYQALISRKSNGDEEVIATIDKIVLKFLKHHLRWLFQDQYDPDTVNYYMQYVGEIDNHFEYGFSQRRIELLELIIEYLECNMVESSNEYQNLIKRGERSEFIRSFVDKSKAKVIGLSYAKLLSLNSDDQVHQAFWMHHKEHILRGLCESSDNIPFLKFIQVYISECQRFVYKQYQLQHLIEVVVELFLKECSSTEPISGNTPASVLKLRKLKYFSAVTESYVDREDLRPNKNLCYSQQQALVKTLVLLLASSQEVSSQSFKKFYVEQIIVTLLKTLTKLYRLNFIDKQIRSEELSEYFGKLMEISNEDSVICVCELMRAFLLKKFPSMASCAALQSCEEYIDSLPQKGQQHIEACMRIQALLGADQGLEGQQKKYFSPTPEQQDKEVDEQFQKFAKSMMEVRQSRSSKSSQPQSSQSQQKQVSPNQKNISSPIKIQSEKQIVEIKNEEERIPSQPQPKQAESVWTEGELVQYIKNILKDPASYSIKEASIRLVDYENIQYYFLLADLFLNSEQLLAKDTSQLQLTIDQIENSIIDHIPVSICPVDSKFYEIMQKNVIGSDICLRKKGGMKATEILSRKLIQTTLETKVFTRYMHNLSKNIASNNELKYLNNIKIYETINGKIFSFAKDQEDLVRVCDFITVTAENQTLKNRYEVSYALSKVLLENEMQTQTKISVIRALTILTHECKKHKQIADTTKIISYLVGLLKDNNNPPILKPASHLLANIIDYGDSFANNLELSQNLEDLVLALLSAEIKKNEYSYLITNCLRILQFLTRNPVNSQKILKSNYPYLMLPISKLSLTHQDLEAIEYELGILSHIIQQAGSKLQQILVDLESGGMIQFWVDVAPVVPKIKKTEMFFSIICKAFTVPEMIIRCMGVNKEILRILLDVLKHNEYDINIIQKWTKVICLLLESSKYIYLTDIFTTNIFYLVTSCLKMNNFLTQLTMDMNMRIIKQINSIEDPEGLIIRHGFASFMIQMLRMKNIQTNDYILLLSILKKLQEKSIFPPHLSTKLFEIVIKKLQNHWNDQLAVRSILLLKKIKKNVEITTEFSHNLYEFFTKFLIQCTKNESYEFYSISREVICLISYYINFNQDIKLLFRNQVVISLLKNWQKIFKDSAEEESNQTVLLWLYSVFNHQSLFYDVCAINSSKLSDIEARFERGWKCNLFRIDGSYKTAVFRLDRMNQQIVAFKFPDGEIKAKYKVPLKNIMLIYPYLNEKDLLFKESRFTRTINPFQHSVDPRYCLTIFCLIEERFQVRQISLQLSSLQDLQQIYYDLKIILNKMYERQKEEEVKVWIARSSKEIPFNTL